jgi:hypothetical protein
MNDSCELENELRKLRPASPSPVLFERVEQALSSCRASVSDAKWKFWRRFTEWSRRDASDIDGQLGRARERERTSQTPHNTWSLGFGLAAAAVLVLFAVVTMERRHERQETVVKTSAATTERPVARGTAQSMSPDRFVSAGGTNLVYNARDEGLHFADGSERPLRRLRYQTQQTWRWRNPETGASLRVSYPSEEIVLIPVSGQ